LLSLGIIQPICFFEVSVSSIKIPKNFVVIIGTVCLLSYIMLRFGINLLLAVNRIKCVVLKFTESKFALNHSFIHSRTMLISFRKSLGFELETNIFVSSANKIVKDLLF